MFALLWVFFFFCFYCLSISYFSFYFKLLCGILFSFSTDNSIFVRKHNGGVRILIFDQQMMQWNWQIEFKKKENCQKKSAHLHKVTNKMYFNHERTRMNLFFSVILTIGLPTVYCTTQ